MIVVCSTCHARFKVADEKIGPRGAKVRCSKCQTVFLVHRDLGVMPAEPRQAAPAAPPPPPAAPAARGLDLDLESEPMGGVRPSGLIADPFARAPAADPFTMPVPRAAAPDPFSAQQPQPLPHDPFSAATPDPQADQFSAADPFGGAGGGSFGAVDPFVATVSSGSPGLPTSAVTDLSDLIGSPAGTPVPAASRAPAPAPATTPPPDPSGILDTGFDFDPSAAPSPELEVAPTPLPGPVHVGAAPEPDLALAERTPTPGLPMPRSSAPVPGLGDFAGADLFEAQGGLEMDGGHGFGGAEEDAFGRPELTEPPPPAAPPSPPVEPAPAPAAPPAAVAAPEAGPEEAAAEGLRQRSSRVRPLLVNAVSLVALVLVAVGFLALWRGVRPGAGIHPGSLFGALSTQPQPFGASQLRSGLFERSDAAPILFVAGKAVSHGTATVHGLRVRVELVRRGAVVASGEARAGAVPSSEELYAARDAAAIAAVFARLEAKAPDAVKPGEAIPFLVAISDYPADISGIGLKVSVEPAGRGAEGKGAPQR